jgi:hypothetical protein
MPSWTARGTHEPGQVAASLELIEACHEILAEIQPASVRAVCYRLFVAGYITSMAKSETNRVSRQLTDAREAGRIPEGVDTWSDPAAFVDSVMRAYRRNKWDAQPERLKV